MFLSFCITINNIYMYEALFLTHLLRNFVFYHHHLHHYYLREWQWQSWWMHCCITLTTLATPSCFLFSSRRFSSYQLFYRTLLLHEELPLFLLLLSSLLRHFHLKCFHVNMHHAPTYCVWRSTLTFYISKQLCNNK